MKILIAYDGSDCAEAALDDLQLAGLPADVEAVVLSVAEVWLPTPSVPEVHKEPGQENMHPDLKRAYEKHHKALEEARAMAERARDRLQTNFPMWKVIAEKAAGTPSWEIINKADAWQPDLVVVGSKGHSALGRLVLGSVAQKVLTEARCSVRIARGRVEQDPTTVRIVIGVDGSADSLQAVRSVARRNWPNGSEAWIVIVEDQFVQSAIGRVVRPLMNLIDDENEDVPERVRAIAAEASRLLTETRLKVSSVIHNGDPKRVLVEEAEKCGADCIFVGSTGSSSRVSRFLLGSVSATVAARAHCSVEVVRSPSDK